MASVITVISKAQYRRATWKNGLGYTDEIQIYPPHAELKRGDFLWRLSSARIEQASAFSVFPDHDRVLVILDKGVRLTHTFTGEEDTETADISPLCPYEFPGDIQSRCELISGPVTDLSAFVHKTKAQVQAQVQTVNGAFEWIPEGRWNFAFAAKGNFEVKSPTGPLPLIQGDTLRIELTQPGTPTLILGDEGSLVLVSFTI